MVFSKLTFSNNDYVSLFPHPSSLAGKILESMSSGALMGSQALLQNFAKELSSAQQAAGLSGGGPPVLTSCLIGAQGSGGPAHGQPPPLSPASSCGSSTADLASSRSLPPRLSPAPCGPGGHGGHVHSDVEGSRVPTVPGRTTSSSSSVGLDGIVPFHGAHQLMGSHPQVNPETRREGSPGGSSFDQLSTTHET